MAGPEVRTTTLVPQPPSKGDSSTPQAYVVPKGTDELTWKMAAAWAGVSVAELLADTASVKSVHYMGALRVGRTLDEWLEQHDEAAAARALEAAELASQPFYRAMVLAEELSAATASAIASGDAVKALKYSSFEMAQLQVAAGLQIANEIQEK